MRKDPDGTVRMEINRVSWDAMINNIMIDEWEDKAMETQEEIDEWAETAWDDVNNVPLPMEKVRAARKEEMEHSKGKRFVIVKKSEAWRVTGKAPMSTKWVDTDKSHGKGKLDVRSRWVARDFKTRGEKYR